MPQSIHKDFSGADWPLGFIGVPSPGTPVSIMSLVDPTNLDAPATSTSPTRQLSQRQTPTCNVIMGQAVKPGATHGIQMYAGNIYIMRAPQGTGSGNRDDYGAMVMMVPPGGSFLIPASGGAPLTSLSPYRYWIDADNANDGALVTLIGVA